MGSIVAVSVGRVRVRPGVRCVCARTLVTKPCGTMPGGCPGLTREQVSISYRAERRSGVGVVGVGRGSYELLASALPAASPAVPRQLRKGNRGVRKGERQKEEGSVLEGRSL